MLLTVYVLKSPPYSDTFDDEKVVKATKFTYILGQKRNAPYKTYIVYGGNFTNLSQTICHSLNADSWFMSSWGFTSYHCHRTKSIDQLKPTFLSILTSRN